MHYQHINMQTCQCKTLFSFQSPTSIKSLSWQPLSSTLFPRLEPGLWVQNRNPGLAKCQRVDCENWVIQCPRNWNEFGKCKRPFGDGLKTTLIYGCRFFSVEWSFSIHLVPTLVTPSTSTSNIFFSVLHWPGVASDYLLLHWWRLISHFLFGGMDTQQSRKVVMRMLTAETLRREDTQQMVGLVGVAAGSAAAMMTAGAGAVPATPDSN